MLPIFLLVLLAAILFVYVFMPSVWLAIMARDDYYPYAYSKYRYAWMDGRDVGVASKNPFRESGPPVCMAKLIMMRHKIHQSNSRKRRASAPPPLPHSLSSPKPRVLPQRSNNSPRLYPPSNFPPKSVPVSSTCPSLPLHLTPRPPYKRSLPLAKSKPVPTRSSWMGMHTRFSRAFGKQHH